MKNKQLVLISLVVLSLIVLTSVALASSGSPKPATPPAETVNQATAALASSDSSKPATTLPEMVRQATAQFKDVRKATGYALLHGCVSGPQEGAMGIHYANGKLVGDGALDVMHPEALLYEPKDGKLQLTGVEYIVDANTWDTHHNTPPVLMGQLFNYVGAPNRFRIPAFYELHVWAWKSNPDGVFADWNPRVSCEDFVGDGTMH